MHRGGDHPPREPQNEAIPGIFLKKTNSPKVAPQPALKGSGGRLFGALGVLKNTQKCQNTMHISVLEKTQKSAKMSEPQAVLGDPKNLKKQGSAQREPTIARIAGRVASLGEWVKK